MKSIAKDLERNNPVSQILEFQQNVNDFRYNLEPLINIGKNLSCNVTSFISNKLCGMSDIIGNLLDNSQIIIESLSN